ncbi:MAG: hypothetical protein AAFU85_32800, partial [Planctomycetota bacterium]
MSDSPQRTRPAADGGPATNDGPSVRSRRTPAMLLSLGFHLGLLVTLFWMAASVTKGTGEVDREIGI